ncbi:MAG: hypothetical protein Q7T11_09240, partial [Deltaproteobacteria bacterium]|nr:hypothetical protein [Deltaproteobacteria bacterium]
AYLDKLAHNRGLITGPERRVYVMLGDASAAEPESRSDLQFAVENGLDNLVFIVDCNTNGLDGVILPDDEMIQYQERTFAGAGFHVIKLVTSSDWNELIQKGGSALQDRWAKMTDGELQAFARGTKDIRKEFFGAEPRLAELIRDEAAWTDDRLKKLFSEGRGGHDLRMINNAFATAAAFKGKPTAILALTTKGRGMGQMEAAHTVHNEKQMRDEDLLALAEQLKIPLSRDEITSYTPYKPDPSDPLFDHIRKIEEANGGDYYFGNPQAGKPHRKSMIDIKATDLPDTSFYEPFYLGPKYRLNSETAPDPNADPLKRYLLEVIPAWEAHEQMQGSMPNSTSTLVNLIDKMLGHATLGPMMFFVVADEITTFGANTLPPKFGYADLRAPQTLNEARQSRRGKSVAAEHYRREVERLAKELAAQAIRESGAPEAEIAPRMAALPETELEAWRIRVLARREALGLGFPPEKIQPTDPVWVRDGQVVQVGINEARGISFLTAAGKEGLVPIWMVYSAFGWRRVGDQIMAATDMRVRGFIIGATAGGTTLNGEGLLHQERADHLIASGNPAVKAYDPAFAYEQAVLMEDGLHRMHDLKQDVLYYITSYNEAVPTPPMPAKTPEDKVRIKEGIIKGGYLLSRAEDLFGPPPAGKPIVRVKLLGSGTLLMNQLKAQRELYKMGIYADVYSITSYSELRRDALEKERDLALNYPGKTWSDIPEEDRPYIMNLLGGDDAPVIAVTDYLKMVPDQISRWIGKNFVSLGTDGFGRSSTRESLREYFEISSKWIVYQAALQLNRQGKFHENLVELRDRLGIDPDKPDPSVANPRAERLKKEQHKEIRRALAENAHPLKKLAQAFLTIANQVPLTKAEEFSATRFVHGDPAPADWRRFAGIVAKQEAQDLSKLIFTPESVSALNDLMAWAAGGEKKWNGAPLLLNVAGGSGTPPKPAPSGSRGNQTATRGSTHVASVGEARPEPTVKTGRRGSQSGPTEASGRLLVGDFPLSGESGQTFVQGAITFAEGNTLRIAEPQLTQASPKPEASDKAKSSRRLGRARDWLGASLLRRHAVTGRRTLTGRPLEVLRGGKK